MTRAGETNIGLVAGILGVAAIALAVLYGTGVLGPGDDMVVARVREVPDPTPGTEAAGKSASLSSRQSIEEVPWAQAQLQSLQDSGVRVLVRQNGAPPEASVTVVAIDTEAIAKRRSADLDTMLAEHGKRYVCNAGTSILPKPAKTAMVAAWSKGAFALASLGPRTETLTLNLEPDHAVQVRVEDESGVAVAGVAVAMRAQLTPPLEVLAATTGLDGVAILRHLDRYVVGSAPAHAIGLNLPLLRPEEVVLDPKAPPSEPIVLKLPETGSFEVLLFDPAGKLMAPAGVVEVQVIAANPGSETDAAPSRGFRYPIAGGRASIRHVGLGLQCIVTAHVTGVEGQVSRFSGFGPKKAGEAVKVVLRTKAPDVVYLGRVLDAAGKPVAEEDFDFTFTSPRAHNATLAQGKMKTDAEGRFKIPLKGGRRAFADVLTLLRQSEDGKAERKFERSTSGREIQAGDMRLR